ncbi:MAG TPA: hypothetical protein VMS22_13420 [Candidatus Eisenbacteria bacterium]|nr:hypothetical protein [Candidatus Eisenbacteria bacterium]
MTIRVACLLALLCVTARLARAEEWKVNDAGECVQVWSASSLARGPLAMVNSLTLPPRQLIGGGKAGAEDTSGASVGGYLRVPALALIGLCTGTVETVLVLCGGIGDLLTGGYFTLVPADMVTPSLEPMTPRFLQAPSQPPATDPCGRKR